MLNSISNFAVKVDKTLDFIPVISTVTNMVDLIAKATFYMLSKNYCSTYKKIENSPFVKHLNKKSCATSVLLAIPFVNIFFAYHHTTKVRTDHTHSSSVVAPNSEPVDEKKNKDDVEQPSTQPKEVDEQFETVSDSEQVDEVENEDDVEESPSLTEEVDEQFEIEEDERQSQLFDQMNSLFSNFLIDMPFEWLDNDKFLANHKDIKNRYEKKFGNAMQENNLKNMEAILKSVEETLSNILTQQ